MSLLRRLRQNPDVYRAYRRVKSWWQRTRYRLHLVHPSFFMAGPCRIARDLVAAEDVFIGAGCQIGPRVRLGRYVMFGPQVTITGSDHRFDLPGTPMIFSGRPALEETVIGDDVWIGHGALIMAGVRIGRGSVIAAHAVVTRDVPPFEIHGGIPAVRIRDRFASPNDRAMHEAMLDGPVVSGGYCAPIGE